VDDLWFRYNVAQVHTMIFYWVNVISGLLLSSFTVSEHFDRIL
jgi:hypothetical protein